MWHGCPRVMRSTLMDQCSFTGTQLQAASWCRPHRSTSACAVNDVLGLAAVIELSIIGMQMQLYSMSFQHNNEVLMYDIKQRGPRTEPCGTLQLPACISEELSAICQIWLEPVESSRCNGELAASIDRRIWWSKTTVSKAALRSRRTRRDTFCPRMDERTRSLWTDSRAVSVEWKIGMLHNCWTGRRLRVVECLE